MLHKSALLEREEMGGKGREGEGEGGNGRERERERGREGCEGIKEKKLQLVSAPLQQAWDTLME
jgi:hypothetical protein